MDNFNRPPYNTELPRLTVTAYGRNIQNMIDYCVSIPDREERTACAYAIAHIMAEKFPEKVEDGNDHQIWDHINMMSDFKLDIDFPCDVLTRENANPRPEPVGYSSGRIRNRTYGKNLEVMIKKVAFMEPSEEKDAIILMIANHMKKLLLAQNKDGVDDAKVFRDLEELSAGQIRLSPESVKLNDYKIAPDQQTATGKKKKKNKNK